jgi:hypothetical protein
LREGRFDIGQFWFDVALAGNIAPRYRRFIDDIASNSIIYLSCLSAISFGCIAGVAMDDGPGSTFVFPRAA